MPVPLSALLIAILAALLALTTREWLVLRARQRQRGLDAEAYSGTCDVVFVDGSHAYSYVVSDSAKARTMVRPLVAWRREEAKAR